MMCSVEAKSGQMRRKFVGASQENTAAQLFGPNSERTEEERNVCLLLEQIAKEVGAESITTGAFSLKDG